MESEKDRAVKLLAALLAVCDGARASTIVHACANLIGRVYAKNAGSVDDAEREVDIIAAKIKTYIRDHWSSYRN